MTTYDKALAAELSSGFRDYPDFPKPNIVFKDICPILAQPQLLRRVVDAISSHALFCGATQVVGIESRGFIPGVPVALQAGLPFVPARKKGKLPGALLTQNYELEYGTDCIQIQKEAIVPGERYLIVDDVIATGGTAQAAGHCISQGGGLLAGYSFVLELGFLGGSELLKKLEDSPAIQSLLKI